MSTISNLINYCTYLIENSGIIIGFILVFIESFLPILPLGGFVALNVNAFGLLEGIILSWIATTLGCFITYLIIKYLSNIIINKMIKQKTRQKIIEKTEKFRKIKMTNLVLLITLPFAPSFLINFLAGTAGISKEKYLISLLIGKSFMIIFWGYIGKSLIESITNIKAIIFILLTLLIAYIITKIISKKFEIE